MSKNYPAVRDKDWVSNKTQFLFAWGLPSALMIVIWALPLSILTTGIIWMLSLGWMGFACLRNARHCGRTHCFFSGPYFLVSAMVALGIGLQWGAFSWLSINRLGIFLFIATPAISVLPEVVWGTYRQDKSQSCHD